MCNILSKKCGKCETIKPVNEFYKDNSKHDGVGSYCKECSKKNRQKNIDKNKEYYQEYRREKYLLKKELIKTGS